MAPRETGRAAVMGVRAIEINEKAIMVLLIVTNLINYLDRGIIPGANGEFTDFVAKSRELEAASTFK